jgi:uncharacterized protein (TIGR03435 family)
MRDAIAQRTTVNNRRLQVKGVIEPRRILDIVERQLGLKLVLRKKSAQFVVIDHAEKYPVPD